jgi:hypothetical protein
VTPKQRYEALEEVATRLQVVSDLIADVHHEDRGDEMRVVLGDARAALSEILEEIMSDPEVTGAEVAA